MRTIVSGSLAALVFSAAALLAVRGDAQTLPWPTNSPANSAAPAPWPTNPPRAGEPAPAATPAPIMTPPMGAAPMTPIPPQAGVGPGGGGGTPPCMDEFTKLQTETDKRAKAAKAGGQRKAKREEMCKLLRAFEGALNKWVKYVKNNSSKCGIPSQVYDQLSKGHDNIAKTAKQVCEGGVLGGGTGKPKTPTLSDALGTTRIPTAETSRNAVTGTFNTLTGTPFGR